MRNMRSRITHDVTMDNSEMSVILKCLRICAPVVPGAQELYDDMSNRRTQYANHAVLELSKLIEKGTTGLPPAVLESDSKLREALAEYARAASQ